MKILAVDDETLQLEKLEDAIYEAIPDAVVYSTRRPSDAIRIAEESEFDIAFLDVQMRGMTGVQIAAKLKEKKPRLNIIFVTAFEQYKGQAMDLRASGFVTKPVTVEKILNELENLRYPIEEVAPTPVVRSQEDKAAEDMVSSGQEKTAENTVTDTVINEVKQETADELLAQKLKELEEKLAKIGLKEEISDVHLSNETEIQSDAQTSSDEEAGNMGRLQKTKTDADIQRDPIMAAGQRPLIFAQCFGNFDVFDQNHLPVAFDRSRAKEMLAYLISKRGSRCTNREIAAVLFEDSDYSDVQDYYRHIAQSMVKALKNVGADSVIYKDSQSYAIDMKFMECDYYRFLQGDASAKLKYSGEFMSQYTWAEVVNGYLDSQV